MKGNRYFGVMFYLIILEKGRASDCDECSDYLVSGPRGVSDDKITASSFYPHYYGSEHYPKYGRLHFNRDANPKGGAWSPAASNNQQYIQVEFSKRKLVRAILTQGRSNQNQWVTSYSVSYSIDGLTWSTVQNVNKNTIIYTANNDRSTVVTNALPECLEAKYLRIHPNTWDVYIALRFDAIGCSKLDPEIFRHKMNWKRHPSVFNPRVQQRLTQVFETSTRKINICAVKCQQNSLCQSFSLNQNSAKCTGYEEQIYQGDTSLPTQGFEVYFVSTSQLEEKEFKVVERLNLCYKIITSKKTAASASALCKGEKARLLSIRNHDEMNSITDSIRNNLILSQQAHFYVDGSYTNGVWKYATGSNINASVWSPSHPLSGNGGCVALTLDGLETHDCLDSLYFICGM